MGERTQKKTQALRAAIARSCISSGHARVPQQRPPRRVTVSAALLGSRLTYCPGKPCVLADIWDIKWLHRVGDILSIHVIDSACITFPVERTEVSSFCAVKAELKK